MSDTAALAAGVVARNPRAIARAISWLEDGHPEGATLLDALYPQTGRAWSIGITGPPGAGKSTLVDRLAALIRASGPTVAVVAVDPASPFSGGAILGDRIRMVSLAEDAGIYVRSMSNRGHLGGLAAATEGAVAVLDAAGFDIVIVETVGVGQSEIEVAELADTTVLVQPPHLGDGVQAVKAGIMEVPQVFVLNKADLPGAKQAASEIDAYLDLVPWAPGAWRPPVVLAAATSEPPVGLVAVWEALQAHRKWAAAQGQLSVSRAQRSRRALWREAEALLRARLRAATSVGQEDAVLARVLHREITPIRAAEKLVQAIWPSTSDAEFDQ